MVEGVVTRVHNLGFQIEGDTHTWFNFSKFERDITMPSVGDRVVFETDSRGFVHDLEITSTRSPRGVVATNSAQGEAGISYAGEVDRRVLLLKIAVKILSENAAAVDPDEVLHIAETLEQWVNR